MEEQSWGEESWQEESWEEDSWEEPLEHSGRHLEGALGGQGDHRRPRGVLEAKVIKTIVRDTLFCLDETRATLTKHRKNQQLSAGADPPQSLSTLHSAPKDNLPEPLSESTV